MQNLNMFILILYKICSYILVTHKMYHP